MIGAISLAVAALNLPILNDLLGAIYSYIPNIIAAVIIFLIASAVSAGAARFVMRIMGDTVISRMVSTAVPAITMSLAVFMILNQLRIATDIVNILFTAIVGAVALGLALAFGLGGRDVAKGLLEQAADNARAKQAMDTTESTRRATRR
jgi:small-conductance mechanosensitive channel